MADTENAKKEGSPSGLSCCAGDNKVWMVGILGLLVGLLVMYIAMPALFPVKPVTESGGTTVATGTTEAFVLSEAKVQEIGAMLSDMFYVNTGSPVAVTYSRYEELPSHIVLYYTVEGSEMPVYASKDYKYLYPSALDVSEMKGQIAQAMEDMAALELQEQAPAEMQKAAEPKVELYLMSNCPYGNQAENGINDVIYLLEEEIAFEPVYIFSGSAGSYNSLHGPYELNQGIREKIVYNLYGEKKWMEFAYDVNVNCFSSSNPSATIDACWKESANRTGVDVAAVEAEYTANFNAIADAEIAKTSAAAVSGSPTLIMNGAKYQGARTPEAYKAWICEGFLDSPADCNQTLSDAGASASGSC